MKCCGDGERCEEKASDIESDRARQRDGEEGEGMRQKKQRAIESIDKKGHKEEKKVNVRKFKRILRDETVLVVLF